MIVNGFFSIISDKICICELGFTWGVFGFIFSSILFFFYSTTVCISRPDLKKHASEVIVGAQCGYAVLRGAHVYVPGIVSTSRCKSSLNTPN